MKLKKAMGANEVIKVGKPILDPKAIGKALLNETNIVGIFRDSELFGGIPCYHVYRIKKGILYNMILLPNRDLHLMMFQALQDDEYENSVPYQILAENKMVFFDEKSIIDVSKANVPDSPIADQIRMMLQS